MIDEYKPLIKNSKFIYVWTSQILSQLTISIMNFMLIVRLYDITGSSIATSFLWVAYALPAILIGPFAAASVDMYDRRKILMLTNLFQSAVLLAYGFVHEEKFFLLYGVVFAYSLLNQFYLPAEAAAIPAVVPKKHLAFANGLFFLTQQAAIIIGFGVSGALTHYLGYTNTIFLASAFLFLAFVSVSFLPPLKAIQEAPKTFQDAFEHFFVSIYEGYKYIKTQKQILAPLALLIGLQVASAMVGINVPIMANELLGIATSSAGVVMIVPAAIGAIAAALTIPKALKKGLRKIRIIEFSLMSMCFLILLLAFLVPELSGNTRTLTGAVVLGLLGASFVGILIPVQTYLQETVPEDLRGRVFGSFWFIVTIATLIPVIFSGALTELLGIQALLLVMVGGGLFALSFSKKYGQKILENGTNNHQ